MKSRLNKNEVFFIGWFLVLFYYLLIAATNFAYIVSDVKIIKWIIIILAMAFWFVKIMMDKYKKKLFLLIAIFVIVVLIAAIMSGKELLILTLVFFLASNGIDIRRFVRFDMVVRLGFILLIFGLMLLGVLDDNILITAGNVKHSFGWLHSNTLASNAIIVLIDYIYIHWKKFKAYNFIVVLCVLTFLFFYVEARTSLYGFVITALWMIFAHWTKPFKVLEKVTKVIVSNIYIIATVLSYGLVYIYNTKSAFGYYLDGILTHRLKFSSSYMSQYGFSLFGQEIETVSSISARMSGTSYAGVDMSYVLMPIQYGVIYAVGFICIFTFLAYKLYKKKMYGELTFVLFFAIAGLSSNVMLQFYRNFSLVFLWLIINDRNKTTNLNGKGNLIA